MSLKVHKSYRELISRENQMGTRVSTLVNFNRLFFSFQLGLCATQKSLFFVMGHETREGGTVFAHASETQNGDGRLK